MCLCKYIRLKYKWLQCVFGQYAEECQHPCDGDGGDDINVNFYKAPD